ncbi:hypothetical protein KL86CLO1_13122 [uncultured Eubacteriales bacterium]|uniref:Four-carbon acid sugar kinase family protein n=1 Tax=uncultured Eubacteriales bacterium TaxID=172733 RepID=A0A212KH93_9FIRM|nr:hypothetical protein KL86CLO1_13122 [uncultured Eubacteriales bacterium]
MIGMAIIADDLTGACDAGIKLKKLGCSVTVAVSGRKCGSLKGDETPVVAVNTNTRSVTPEQSKTIVADVLTSLQKAGVRHFYKKIDSVLRGNVGAEIDACLERLPAEFALVVPAFLETGRTLQGGILRIDVRGDTPKYVNAVDAVHSTTGSTCAVISVDAVKRGAEDVISQIVKKLEEGATIFLVDACEESDFQIIAQAAAHFGPRCLPVGSAGWLPYLQQIWPDSKKQDSAPVEGTSRLADCDHVLVAIGSRHPATIDQVQEVKKSDEFTCYCISTENLRDGSAVRHARQLAAQIEADAKQGLIRRGILVTTDQIFDGSKNGTAALFYQDAVNDTIAAAIALLVEKIQQLLPVGGLILSGGDVANCVLEQLGIGYIELEDEPIRGVATGKTADEWSCLLATKSGGFGNPEALLQLYRYMCDREG